MFFQVCSKITESKRDEKCTAGNRKCCGNPLGKFLNFKIVYFVLFLSQNTIVVRIFFDFYFVAIIITKHLMSVPSGNS